MKGGKNEAQTVPEMLVEMNKGKERGLSVRRGNSVYKPEADEYKEERLKELVSMSIQELAETVKKKRVYLDDTEEIQRRTVYYLKACEESGTFPSSLGLARSLGYSDRMLRYWRSRHPETLTAQWLEMCNDLFADILNQSALKNNANTISAIFLSKALYDMRDTNELIISPGNEERQQDINVDEIKERYGVHKNEIEGGIQ